MDSLFYFWQMSWNILITDGLEESGIAALRNHGFTVDVKSLNPVELFEELPGYDGIIVRSATKVRTELIDHCPKLKFIARGGVGLDNIDVIHAQQKGIQVINTPASSSRSVAELAMAHMLSITRNLQNSNRNLLNNERFISLKKSMSKAGELKGRTLLLIGLGRIGRELAKMALGFEMKVIACDPFIKSALIDMDIAKHKFQVEIELISLDEGLARADYISMHSPYDGNKILNQESFGKMKKGVFIINTSRGDNIDEGALLKAIDEGVVAGAGLDVFEKEPDFNPAFINHPKISITPHIGASTIDAQLRIAEELVEKIVQLSKD